MVDFLKNQSYKAEYKGEALKQSRPYKGLQEFTKTQYAGDFVVVPDHLKGKRKPDEQ